MAITFTARRSKAELVAPARAPPHKGNKTQLSLSDMDDHHGHRVYIPWVEFFERTTGQEIPADPVAVIKAALAEALVYYYPMAGRLREAAGGNNKLVVDCSGDEQGVEFVEADAGVRLEELGTPPLPPYPCVEELLPDAGNIGVVVGKPIVFVQVTRFACGGFAVGLQMSHCIADGSGMVQFLKAVADVARGGPPAVLPVWERDVLMARAPPSTAYVHRKLMSLIVYRNVPTTTRMVCRYLVFGPAEVSVLRSRAAVEPPAATRFELVTAAIWRCRTAAWGFCKQQQRAVLAFSANLRQRWPPIARGYYGNAIVYHVVDVTAAELCGSPLGRAVALIREAKADATEEHVRSTADFMAAMRRGPPLVAYMVSDWTRLGEDELDMGWARRVAGGVTMPSSNVSYYGTCRSSTGEQLLVASMLLPEPVMQRFQEQMAIDFRQTLFGNMPVMILTLDWDKHWTNYNWTVVDVSRPMKASYEDIQIQRD